MSKIHDPMPSPIILSYFGLSDVGLMRPNNEDVWVALPQHRFFALADGMGGRKGGEIAAQSTIESLCDSMQQINSIDCTELIIELRAAIQKANRHIFQLSSRDTTLAGMGTTLCCLIWTPKSIIYAHVGDSRIYRMRDQTLQLLTEDHSFYTQWTSLCNSDQLQEKHTYPYKHIITRAIGTSERVKPTIARADHIPGDLYLLCSDGLSDMLNTEEMERLLASSSDLERNCTLLIDEAKRKGGPDNMTILLIQSKLYLS